MQKYEEMYHRVIAKHIKEIRKNNKLSQESFAEKIGCSREFVSRLENLKEKPNVFEKNIKRLSSLTFLKQPLKYSLNSCNNFFKFFNIFCGINPDRHKIHNRSFYLHAVL